MKKTLILSISLMALCTACSVESDSVVSVSNKEQVVKSTSISDLTSASLTLTKYFYNNNNSEMGIGELVKTVDGLAKSDTFLKQYNFLANAYSSVSTEDISKIVDKDWSVLDNVMYSSEFQIQVLKMVNGSENLDSYRKEIIGNPKLDQSEQQILLDGLEMSPVSYVEGGVDDEWRKRKLMGYLIAQAHNDLTVVITATVLDIAMKQ